MLDAEDDSLESDCHVVMIAPNKIFRWLIALALMASRLWAQQPAATPQEGANVLILGDSLALCGFGKRLDERFRESPLTKATFTYLACGTNPLSWLRERPYTNIKTHCGFVSMESLGGGMMREVNDVYGQTRGHVPGSHPVPKLEDLLVKLQPDILVMQTGTNLFDLFPDKRSVNPNRHGSELRSFLVPFINKAARTPSNLRKIYWVASLKPLSATATPQAPIPEPTPPAERPKETMLQVKARLVAKTQPVPVEEFLPYQEFLVGYVYDVTQVISGEYSEKQILVMHPAYIKLEEQRLGRWRIGRTYRLQLHELENTVWKTVKSKDDSGLISLQPYIRVQDEMKHPDHAR